MTWSLMELRVLAIVDVRGEERKVEVVITGTALQIATGSPVQLGQLILDLIGEEVLMNEP